MPPSRALHDLVVYKLLRPASSRREGFAWAFALLTVPVSFPLPDRGRGRYALERRGRA
jgi:hypothetical protein